MNIPYDLIAIGIVFTGLIGYITYYEITRQTED